MKRWGWVTLIIVAGAAMFVAFALHDSRDDGLPQDEGPAPGTLRLTGSQFLLNWQSFPGREVLIEFCTIRVVAGQGASCLVFDGARRLGEIGIELPTFERESRAWAEKTCRQSDPGVACSVRLSGTIRKGTDGSALIVQGRILQ